MITLKFKVTENSVVKLEQSAPLTSGNVETIKCEFEFDSAFDGLIIRTVFGDQAVTVINNECYAPALETGRCVIGVYAYATDGEKINLRYSPQPTLLCVYAGSYNENATDATPPTPSEIEAFYAAIQKAIDDGKMRGEQGPQGVQGPQGEQGLTGPQGPKGDDYILTDQDKTEISKLSADKWETIIDNQELTAVNEIDLQSFFVKKYKKLILIFEGNGTKTSGVAGYLCLNNEIDTESGCTINISNCNTDYPTIRSAVINDFLQSLGYKSNTKQRLTIVINCEGGICRTEWLKSTDIDTEGVNNVNCNPLVGISHYKYVNNVFIAVDDSATFTGTLTMRGVEYND